LVKPTIEQRAPLEKTALQASGQAPFGDIASARKKPPRERNNHESYCHRRIDRNGVCRRLRRHPSGATISIQDGNVGKHMHPNTNEIQYILEGTGTVWLGDKEEKVGPGDLIIIPKGTAHGGTKPDGRPLKAIAIKTPPQAPDDTKMLN
jgi:mannose-6-phosphate isomerase-like protein (cupin superfamily)